MSRDFLFVDLMLLLSALELCSLFVLTNAGAVACCFSSLLDCTRLLVLDSSVFQPLESCDRPATKADSLSLLLLLELFTCASNRLPSEFE